jgi:hypothetical protein
MVKNDFRVLYAVPVPGRHSMSIYDAESISQGEEMPQTVGFEEFLQDMQ